MLIGLFQYLIAIDEIVRFHRLENVDTFSERFSVRRCDRIGGWCNPNNLKACNVLRRSTRFRKGSQCVVVTALVVGVIPTI